MKNLIKLTSTLVIAMLMVVTMNNCSKTDPCSAEMENPNDQTELIEKSEAMQDHILAFKSKMEYYRDNPNIKAGGQLYTADSGTLELETLLNFDFCYTGIECSKKKFETSEIIMPLDDVEKITDPKLMEVYYNKIIDTIQAQMTRVNFSNMKLLMVDLEVTGTDINGDAIISVGSLIGAQYSLPPTTEIGWWFGCLGGNCEGPGNDYEGEIDATKILESNILAWMFPAPPPGKIRKKTDIVYIGLTPPEEYWLKPEAQRTNYKDSKIFTAHDDYGTITDDTRCLSSDDEILFYSPKYSQVINYEEGIYNNANNKDYEFTNLIIFDNQELNQNQDHIKIWHDIGIFLGNVWLINDTWVTQDIQNYNTN
jgi:hypothetical protein